MARRMNTKSLFLYAPLSLDGDGTFFGIVFSCHVLIRFFARQLTVDFFFSCPVYVANYP